MPGHLACQISDWYIYFGKHVAQKPHLLMTSFCQTATLSISRHRTQLKMTFLESWEQTGSEKHICFIRKWQFKNLAWCDPGLTWLTPCRWRAWSQIAKLLRFLNSMCKSDHKSCIACPKRFFLFWWPRDLSWLLMAWP